jgi:hypothetical protein
MNRDELEVDEDGELASQTQVASQSQPERVGISSEGGNSEERMHHTESRPLQSPLLPHSLRPIAVYIGMS